MPNKTTIKCPHCATQIDVNEVLSSDLEKSLTQKHADELENNRRKYKEAMQMLKAKETAIKEQKENFDEDIRKATDVRLKIERARLEDTLKKEVMVEHSESMALLQRELDEKSKQVQELNASKAMIEKLKRDMTEVESKVKADAQIVLNNELNKEKAKLAEYAEIAKIQVKKEIQEASELKMNAKDEQLEQIKRELDNAIRKAEQGSMQLQGEALELAIESWLASQFPFDNIEEVKKGSFGADCIHTVHTREIPNCGVICYESKNTKAWSDGWIMKLKQDMLGVNADIGVLVTSVYPKDMKRMGFVDGIWVCSLDEFKGSVSLLRESLIRLQQVSLKEDNKADKMSLLYHYMTGNEFSMQMKAIVDGFVSMQSELEKEKRSLMATWKRRQKTIDGVLANTTEMYGALQGIAGNSSIVHIEALELPYDEEEA